MDLDLDSDTWVGDHSVPANISRNLLLLEHFDHLMNNIEYNLSNKDQAVATVHLGQLAEQAQTAISFLFASGCMPSRDNLSKIDKLSKEHQLEHLENIENHKHLRLLRSTKNQINLVLELLEPNNSSELGDIASWTNFHPHTHTPTPPSPAMILQTDTKFLSVSLIFIDAEVKKNINRSSPVAPQRSNVSISSLQSNKTIEDSTICSAFDIDSYKNNSWRKNIFGIVRKNYHGSLSFRARMKNGLTTVATMKLRRDYEKENSQNILDYSGSVIGFNKVQGYEEEVLTADVMEQLNRNHHGSKSHIEREKKGLIHNLVRCMAIGHREDQPLVNKPNIQSSSVANMDDLKSFVLEESDNLDKSNTSEHRSQYSACYNNYFTESHNSLDRMTGSLDDFSQCNDPRDSTFKESCYVNT